MVTRVLIFLFGLVFVLGVEGAGEIPSGVPVLTPEEMKNYEFPSDADEEPPVLEDLSVGQRFILDGQRREIKDLIERELGVLELKGNKEDLRVIQQMVDRRVLRNDQVKEWQSLGVIFGDILVNELGLHWVSYRDERGTSKALQWRDTLNVVFPITVFSKRAEFGRKIDVQQIYDDIRQDVENFATVRPTGG